MSIPWRTASVAVTLAVLLAVLLAACAPTAGDRAVGPATLHLAATRMELAVTACALIGGRLLEELPEGGAEVAVIAEGHDDTGIPVRVTARRGTDVVAPHRFEVLEITWGEVSDHLEVVVVLRGFDRATATWTQVDPDVPGARRAVPQGLFEIDGARLVARGTAVRAAGEGAVPVAFEALCPPQLERDPGLA